MKDMQNIVWRTELQSQTYWLYNHKPYQNFGKYNLATVIKQDRQYTYTVIWRRVRTTIVIVNKQ